jgi:hypothetical protein
MTTNSSSLAIEMNDLTLKEVAKETKEVVATCCEKFNICCFNCTSNLGFYFCCCLRYKVKIAEMRTFILGLAILLLFLMASILIGELIIQKDLDHVDTNVKTLCTFQKLQTSFTKCCDPLLCQCSECSTSAFPTCVSAQTNSTSASTCCGDAQCCSSRTTCDTCSYTYGCNCGYNSKNIYVCKSTCTGTEDCNCKTFCTSQVSHKSCSLKCGLCSATVVGYYFTLNSTATNNIGNINITNSFIKNCGRDDNACLQTIITNYPAGEQVECWYDKLNPNSGVSLNQPVFQRNIGAIVGVSICALVGFLGLVIMCLSVKIEKKNTKK